VDRPRSGLQGRHAERLMARTVSTDFSIAVLRGARVLSVARPAASATPGDARLPPAGRADHPGAVGGPSCRSSATSLMTPGDRGACWTPSSGPRSRRARGRRGRGAGARLDARRQARRIRALLLEAAPPTSSPPRAGSSQRYEVVTLASGPTTKPVPGRSFQSNVVRVLLGPGRPAAHRLQRDRHGVRLTRPIRNLNGTSESGLAVGAPLTVPKPGRLRASTTCSRLTQEQDTLALLQRAPGPSPGSSWCCCSPRSRGW